MSAVPVTFEPGDVLGPLSPGPVTRTTLALFAGGSGDHNEVHLDVEQARAAGMDDVFAHGMLGMAHLGRLLTDSFGQAAVSSFSVRFAAVTPVGAQPTCVGVVDRVDGDLATVEITSRLTDGTVTLRGTATIHLPSLTTQE